MQSSANNSDTKARSNYGKARIMKENLLHRVQMSVRRLAAALVLFGFAPPPDAWAQDVMSDRYAAIRAPTEALMNRIARRRLQADLNALAREQVRIQSQRRLVERLRHQDPVSGFAAAERALDARLGRIGIEQRETAARLANLSRERGGGRVSALPSLRSGDGADADLRTDPTQFDARLAAGAVDAARAFVDELLSANRARP